MDALLYRVFLASLAIAPLLILALMPTVPVGIPIAFAVSAMGIGVFALRSVIRRHGSARRIGPALLRNGALRHMRRELPSPAAQRDALADVLAAAHDVRAEPEAPPTRATAVARILSRMLTGWKITDLDDLPDDLAAALTLLERLLNADPGEAGRLAQCFQRPDLVLGLRDEIDRIAYKRARHDHAFAAFEATRVMQAADPAPRDLLEALKFLGEADVDLWHRIVTEHDPFDPAQRAAALWCLSRPDCDRATVAAFFARLTDGAQLQTAARNGDRDFVETVRSLIARCNASYYTKQEIAFAPPPDAKMRLARELDALAELTGAPRLPDPQCAILALDGRAPRPRPAWDLVRGGLVEPPKRADYL